jgi:methyltransferase (TIGR00027 family)
VNASSASTAFSVSLQRALHGRLDPPPHILEDHVAWRLLSDDERQLALDHPGLFDSSLARNLRRRVLLRQRYAEDALQAAVEQGVRQYVVLGAGMDTFALRQPKWAEALRIFEVDRATEQESKRTRMEAAGLSAPANLHLVQGDFEDQDWFSALRGSGFSLDEPTLFACLGVLVYLSQPAIERLLALPLAMRAPTEMVFTISTAADRGIDRWLAHAAASQGEVWRTPLETAALSARLGELGFQPPFLVQPADLARRLDAEAQQQAAMDRTSVFHVRTPPHQDLGVTPFPEEQAQAC